MLHTISTSILFLITYWSSISYQSMKNIQYYNIIMYFYNLSYFQIQPITNFILKMGKERQVLI